MKKIYLLLLVCFLAQWSQAQIINIPDANFKNYLLNAVIIDTDNDFFWDSTIDINNDGEIQESEALLATELTPISRQISSFEGIQYFTNLELFECSNNPISNLSLPNNVNLKTLICTNYVGNNSLTSIDISQNVNLESLSLSSNDLLSTLDITQNVNLENLNISRCNFTSIDVSQNINLRRLVCDYNPITSLDVTQNLSLENLNLTNNQLSSLDVTQNGNLNSLQVSGNALTSINVTQNSNLRNFSIGNNNIANIDVTQNANLQSFNCFNTLITSIDVTQNPNLEVLGCHTNNLTTLDVSQNPDLNWVVCYGNQFTTLDFSQNPNLEWLECNDNLLTTINLSGATNLERLYVNDNSLTTIDVTTNSSITYFECNNNSLTQLDLSGNPALLGLKCNYNSLTQLDLSQNPEMINLDCTHNSLTVLDVSQNPRLDDIDCFNNQLTYLNVKNGINSSIFELRFDNNPTLEFICVDEDELASIAPLASVPATAVVSTYCSFTPGGEYIVVQGSSTLDMNTNGCDVNDTIFPSMELSISDGFTTETIITDTSGDYSVYLPVGTSYTITPQLENPAYFTVSPTSITVNTTIASNPTIQDFCVTPTGSYNDVDVTIVPLEGARPGFDTDYKIVYKNKGNTTLSGTVQLTFDDDVMDLVSANPMVDTQAANTLTWNYTSLAPLESRSIEFTMNINSPVEVPAVNGGDILNFQATINPVAGDETPDDNVMTVQQTVVNSFDPNDIRCLEGETVTTDYIDEYVHYLIRFENTGTAAAVNVVVTDEIDMSKFDISTLRPVSSSHTMVTNIKNGNEVEFTFENINLPFDDATNDGYIVFKIKTLATLQENDTFSSVADIYFDFNFPITTNTATTVISNPLSISDEDLPTTAFLMYPNPANNYIQITSKDRLQKLVLCTLDGKQVMLKDYTDVLFSTSLDVSSLSKGMYIVQVETANEIYTRKMIKQ